jgi:hypothetical protein
MGHDHKYMGHETANWGGRGLGYMLFNADLCNQLGRKRLCTSRFGDSQVPMTLEHDNTNVSLGRMAY